MMTNLIMKLVAGPVIVLIAEGLFPNVDYGAVYQPIVVGLIVAIVGLLMEYMLLRERTVWTSTIADFVAAVLLVYIVSNLFADVYVTFWGAVWTALLFAVVEHFVHLWLVRTGRTETSAY